MKHYIVTGQSHNLSSEEISTLEGYRLPVIERVSFGWLVLADRNTVLKLESEGFNVFSRVKFRQAKQED